MLLHHPLQSSCKCSAMIKDRSRMTMMMRSITTQISGMMVMRMMMMIRMNITRAMRVVMT